MLKRLHVIAAAAGFATILAFWLSTVLTELFGTHHQIANVRQAIVLGLFVLVPALLVAGATGTSMAGSSTDPRVRAKKRRMSFIAVVGVLVLAPTAIYLDRLASRGEWGTLFHTVQAVELTAGAIGLALMFGNARDGLRLSGRLPAPAAKVTGAGPSIRTRRRP